MNPALPHLDRIDTQSAAMRQRVERWANINTGTFNAAGIAQLVNLLHDEFAPLADTIEIQAVAPITTLDDRATPIQSPLGPALRVRRRPHAPIRVFLCIHTDTVYAADHPFQQVTQLDSNTLRGPGVTDAKGGIAVMLTALQAFERIPGTSALGWEVLLNPDEEIGSPGSGPLLAEAARHNHIGLLFEPALPDGSLVGRRKGSGNFTLIVRGRSAHAGRDFDRGRNAIVAMAKLVLELHALNGALPGVTVNVGRIEGGGAPNVVPDLAVTRVNIRTTEPGDEALVRKTLDELLGRANAQDGIRAELHGQFTSPPKLVDQRTESLMQTITSCGRELGLELAFMPSGGASDGNKLAAAGLPNIDSLGVRGGDIHSPSEFLQLDSLAERAKLTTLVLMRLARGENPMI